MTTALIDRVKAHISTDRLERWSRGHAEPMTLEDAADIAYVYLPGELADEVDLALYAR